MANDTLVAMPTCQGKNQRVEQGNPKSEGRETQYMFEQLGDGSFYRSITNMKIMVKIVFNCQLPPLVIQE